MKHTIPILALIVIILHSASAAVPLKWTVETSRVQPAVFDVVRGETIALEATMQSHGKPLEMAGKTVSIFWQTNGMANAWWSAPASVRSDSYGVCPHAPTNILSATFTPAMDPGASAVTGFIGSTGEIYRAAFQLRFRHGPGATPNVIEQPPPVLDLAHTVVINPPWPTDQTIDARIRRVIADDDITANVPTGMVRTVVSNTVTKAYVESLGISGGGSSIDTNAVIDIATSVVARKADAEILDFSILHDIEYGDGMSVTYIITYKNGVADSVNAWWGRNVDERLGEFTNSIHGVVSGEVSYSKYYVDNGVFYSIDMLREYGRDKITVIARRGNDDSIVEYFNVVEASNKLSVVQSIERRIIDPSAATSTGKAADALKTKQSLATKADQSALTQIGSDVSQLNLQVTALGANANAEDARFVSTNYNSSTRMPEAYVEVKVSNSWITVWREMTRWNWFLSGYADYTNDVASALANKGEREWGWFDSATGSPSPDGILQLSQPRILICSGAAYQRYATASGAAWVLESNGLVSDINGTTNGFFRISDEEGNAHFEIVKGDKQTLFATARTMTQQQMGVTHYFTTYAVTNAVAQPTAEFTRSLSPVAWIREGEQGFPCNVRWTNNGNNSYTVEWWPIGDEPQMFMRCGYERGGETYIRNNAPVSMDYIYLGGVKYRLGTATISGHTVLTLTQQ